MTLIFPKTLFTTTALTALLALSAPVLAQDASEADSFPAPPVETTEEAEAPVANDVSTTDDADASDAAPVGGIVSLDADALSVSDAFSWGEATAPITVVKYASLTCPHCANFHNQTLDTLKDTHIAEGRVRYVHKHFPLDQYALLAATLPHCAVEEGVSSFSDMLDALYASQRDWMSNPNPASGLLEVAASQGMTTEMFGACMNNGPLVDAILTERLQGAEHFEVRATPTFVINGTTYEGHLPPESFQEIFDEIDLR